MINKNIFLIFTVMILSLTLVFAISGGIQAQSESDFPSDDLTIILPWSEGGFTDVMVRPLAEWLEDYFEVSVIVENISGGGGVIGSKEIEKADPDGYTIGTTSMSTITAKYMSPSPPDMSNVDAIAHIFNIPAALVVHKDSEWETLEDFVSYAKENPGEIMTSNSGFGASVHMNTVLFEKAAGIELSHVPYDSTGETITAVLGKHVDASFSNLPDVVEQVRAGDLRLLAIATAEPHDNYPEVPTFTEKGYEYVTGNYTGIVAPKGVEQYKIDILAEAMKAATQDEGLREFMLSNQFSPEYYGPEEFRAFLNRTEEDIEYMVEELGIEIVD